MTVPAPFAVFLARRTWGELLYAILGLGLGVAGFALTVTSLTVSAGLLVTFVGIPLLAATGLASRYLGSSVRALGNTLVGDEPIPPPAPFRSRPGVFGWIGSCLTDGTAWRARLYLLLKLPLGILTFVSSVAFYTYGLGGVTYAIWRPFLPCDPTAAGVCRRGAQLGDNRTVDRPFLIIVTTVVGLLLLLAAPWVVRAVVRVDRLIARLLLGPTGRDARVAELEQSRATAVDDAATTLRRIERDLHDGTQARLVSLAMNVGLAKEKLAEGGDPAEAERLLAFAHTTAKEAIAEVRDLARGIHPPVLDAGLDAALATLAANSVVPVRLETSISTRPVAAIETIAYFCVAELLTNVAKHSGAGSASVDARTLGGELVLTVSDNGHGGAQPGRGTGLAGLFDRVRTVDGTLAVHSPPGGPTLVTIRLPLGLGS